MEENIVEEKKKSNVGLIVFLVLIILGLAGYICYDKFFTKDIKPTQNQNEKQKEETQKPTTEKLTTEEDEIYTAGDGEISCESKTRNLVYISYEDFDDQKLTKNDVCNTYVIEESNIKLIPKVMVLDNNEVDYAQWKIVANGKAENVPYYGYIKVGSYKDYIYIGAEMLAGDYTSHYIFDQNGNLIKLLNAFDDNNCAYMESQISKNTFVLVQDYVTEDGEELAASNTCINDNIVKEKCGSNYNALSISYELVDENGILSLKELTNYKCK